MLEHYLLLKNDFFFEEMGIEVKEDLKLVEDDEWDDLYEDMCWSKIKLRKFKVALC